MIVEVIGASVTAIVWAGLHYGNVMHKRAHEAEMLNDPARCRARRRGIERRRKILLRQREMYQSAWNASKNDEARGSNWSGMVELDKRLDALAREEADIPLFDELDEQESLE